MNAIVLCVFLLSCIALCCVPSRFNEGLCQNKHSMAYANNLFAATRRQFCPPLVDTCGETADFIVK